MRSAVPVIADAGRIALVFLVYGAVQKGANRPSRG